jgi:activated CDC42 kinase 1
METLGEGNFSVVKRALWTRPDGSKTDCAVKILHEMSEPMRQDLATEISTMQRLRHQNLVQLFGVVFGDASTLMVIEYCEGGSLLDRLRDGTKPRPLVTTLLNYAQQISTGMSYLETRRCVHRDLAARNVLLTHDEQVWILHLKWIIFIFQ